VEPRAAQDQGDQLVIQLFQALVRHRQTQAELPGFRQHRLKRLRRDVLKLIHVQRERPALAKLEPCNPTLYHA
jgi:hypothetical protein